MKINNIIIINNARSATCASYAPLNEEAQRAEDDSNKRKTPGLQATESASGDARQRPVTDRREQATAAALAALTKEDLTRNIILIV